MTEQKVLKYFVKNVRKRVSEDRVVGMNDAVICISGDTGVGKSTLMLWLCGIFAGKKFDLDRHILYSPHREQIVEKMLVTLPPGAPVGMDEALKAFYKHRWQSSDSRYLNEFFNICRKQRKIVLLCIPRFQDLMEYFRNDRVFIRIYVIKRGLAAVFIRMPTPYGSGGWHWDKVGRQWDKFIEARRRRGTTPLIADTLRFFKQEDPCFVGTFQYPLLPVEIEKEYGKRVDEVKYDLTLDGHGGTKLSETMERLRVTAQGLHKKGWTQKQIAELMNLTQGRISQLLQKRNT